jgi:Xaa-Pro aminopeptidase
MATAAAPVAEERRTRLARLREVMGELGLDAAVLSRAAHKRYFAGFILAPDEEQIFAGTLLVTAAEHRILVDSRFTEQAASESADWSIVDVTGIDGKALSGQVAGLGARRIGIEERILRHAEWRELAETVSSAELVPIDDELARMRAHKSSAEVDAIARACAISDACFGHLLDSIRIGMTEREVAGEIEDFFRRRSDGPAFSPIVLVGGRASMPHGRPSEAPIEAGQMVLLDFGCSVEGYRSDMSRTIFIGRPTDEARRAYEAVAAAQGRAIKAVEPGISGRLLDAEARGVIIAAGFDPYRHGLGHGIGLEVHEAPSVRQGREDPVEAGMVFTIEPGVYLPGRMGIRIEDVVHLGSGGPELLTTARRDLVIVE